jgi:CRP-like cAMP-binding protein
MASSRPTPSPILDRLPREGVERLLRGGRRRRFGKGEVVFHEGDLGDTLHFIVRGRFAVTTSTASGDAATLAILGAGELFGELALLREDAHRTASVVATEAGETVSIDRDELAGLRRRHPEVADVLLALVADKVARYTRQLIEALYVPAELRVLRRLLELADTYDREDAIPITQAELAGLAGTSRATVNKVLRHECERGSLRLRRGRVEVLQRPAIERRAGA